MRVYQKGICCLLASVMLAGSLTGCGGSSKKGESDEEAAARAYMTALVDDDVESYLSLIPDDFIEYLVDEYYVSEKQVEKAAENYLKKWGSRWTENERKEWKKKVKSSKPDESYEFEVDDIQELNEELEVIRAESAYWLDYDSDCDYECTVFEYDGRWYSYEAATSIQEELD